MKNLVVLFSGETLAMGSLFKNAEMEAVYKNIIQLGKKEGAFVSISIPSLVKGTNVKKAVTYQGKWKIVRNIEADYILDKLCYGGKRKRIIREISEHIKVINDPDLSIICDNKLLAHKTFPRFSPQTFDVTRKNFKEVIEKIQSQKIVFKPWYGSGSKGVVIKEKSQACFNDIGNQYIAQEYIDTRGGIKGIPRQNMLRFIILNSEIVFRTLETAKSGDIVSGNVKAVKVTEDDVPFKKIKEILNSVDSVFRNYFPRLYCVDFFVTKDGRICIGEMNSKPGLFPSEGESQVDYNNVIRKFFRSLSQSRIPKR
ncbi:MAG: ATP-grasp domain-containing protein [Candidatus Aenigmarchaeota archaeon]|nr:ATP-grasp domain-containing protein [Candidatus Aenigmarchaeota archaeon]